jgi:SAM-dependent methyltransferase
VTFEQAAPVLQALPSNRPAALRGRSTQEMARLWPSWVERHDRDVRARLERGDEDSLVNFWLYGTSFTSQPPAVARASPLSAASLNVIIKDRLEDLLDRVTRPGDNERLQFARRMLAARNADPTDAPGRERARHVLLDTRQRMIREFAGRDQTLASATPGGTAAVTAANATIFRDRGLSSDTSILSDYSVHVALETIARQKTLAPGSVRRVAIVGPGLDFTNKADGYDYYAQQTTQPFALINTLRRLGLAAADLQVTTFDINLRVNDHLRNAPVRAASSSGYLVSLPLAAREGWTSAVEEYWQQWGNTIGDEVTAVPAPAAAGVVKTRTVRIQPAVVSSIVPRDLNIVVDRLPVASDERFDLVVATNVLFYYDVFEQALAAANVAAMLKPGGLFVTNTAILPTPPLNASASYLRVAHTAERYDEMFWYQRQRRD